MHSNGKYRSSAVSSTINAITGFSYATAKFSLVYTMSKKTKLEFYSGDLKDVTETIFLWICLCSVVIKHTVLMRCDYLTSCKRLITWHNFQNLYRTKIILFYSTSRIFRNWNNCIVAYLFSFVETPHKFVSTYKAKQIYIVLTMQTYKELN